MDNVFITQLFDWDRLDSPRVRLLHRLFALLGFRARVVVPRQTGEMTSVEQRVNLFHLASQVLAFGVPGALVEVGCHRGSTAVLLRKVIDQHDPTRGLHVYDAFLENTPAELLNNFRKYDLRPPVVHEGLFERTLPGELPAEVCFAHVDIGVGRPQDEMTAALVAILEALYPRLAPGAVCVLADYCDPAAYRRQGHHFPNAIRFADEWHLYPAVKRACDAFLAGKPEEMCMLYAGDFSHGFFRKR